MISPGLTTRLTTAPWFSSRNVPETPLKTGSCRIHSASSFSPDRLASTTRLFVRAPVGHETMHSPHETHVELPIGRSRSKPMCAVEPPPLPPITQFFL